MRGWQPKTERLLLLAALAVLALTILLSQLSLVARWVPLLDNVHWTVATAATALVAVNRWRRTSEAERALFGCIAAAMVLYCAGQTVWDIESLLGTAVFPGPADLLSIQAGFWVMAGFFWYTSRQLRGIAVLAIGLDTGLVAIAALCITLSLYAPLFTTQTLATKAILLSFPVSIFAAIGATLCTTIALRLRPDWGLLLFHGAMLGNGVAWGAWIYVAMQGEATGGSIFEYALSVFSLGAGAGISLWEVGKSRSHRWERACVELQRVLPLVMALVGAAAVVLGRSYAFAVGISADISVLFIIFAALVTHALMLYERDQLLMTRRELEHSEVRFQAIFRQSNQLLAVVSTDGTLLDVNDFATRFIGTDPGEVIGLPFADTPWWNHSAEEQAKIRLAIQVAANGSIYSDVAERVDQQGELHTIEYNVSPARDRDGNVAYVVAAGQDVTERRMMEQQLQQAHKLEAIGQLAGGVAHDFNNLLTVIMGYSELLLLDDGLPPEYRSALTGIREAAERGEFVARQLLLFSRRHVHETRLVNLNEQMRGLERLLQRLLPENIVLEFEPDVQIGQVNVDPGQVEQIVINLAINARDAMAKGGIIRIGTRHLEIEKGSSGRGIRLSPGRYVQLLVADNGSGMPPEVKRRAFEPFFTTKPVGQGTGLGLATVYGCVTQNAGHIEIESQEGLGTKFIITWPAVQPDGAAKESARDAAVLVPGTETILLVEDEEGVRNLAHRMLSMQGYRVLAAANAEQALELAHQHTGDLHLMITDMIMPGISGKELCERLSLERPKMKTLFMSGYIDDEFLRESPCGPACGFLQKPFDIASLLNTVRNVLGGETAAK